MLEILGTILGSIFSGGATGIVGAAIQRYADFKNRELDIQLEKMRGEQRLAEKEKDAEIMAREWEGRARVATIEGDTAKDVADSNAFAEGLKSDQIVYSNQKKLTWGQNWMMVILDFSRGIIRPGLTIYLCVLTTLIYFEAKALIGKEDLTPEEALKIMHLIIGTILYLTTTCVSFWFFARNRQEPPKL